MKSISKKIVTAVLAATLAVSCEAATFASCEAASSDKVIQYSMGTGASTGGYYYQGAAVTKVVNDYFDGYMLNIEATGGTAENIGLVNSGEVECAYAAIPDVMDALAGENGYVGKQSPNLRLVMVTGFNYIQWFALKDSGITNVNQIPGNKIGYAVSAWQMKKTLKAMFDVEDGDGFECQYAAHADNAESLKDGIIKVMGFDSSIPNSTITDLATTHDIVYLDTSEEDYQKLCETYSDYGYVEIPEDCYRGVGKGIHALTCPVGIITYADADEEFIYQLTKQICENTEAIINVSETCKQYSKENAIDGIDISLLHPGAVRYYKEAGLLQ